VLDPRAEYQRLTAHASLCLETGRTHEAEATLRVITQINPREPLAWAQLAKIALERGATEAAVELLRQALKLDRKNSDYLNLLGVAYAELGRYDDALSALRRSLRERPASAETHYNIGKVLHKRSDLASARDAFVRAIAIDPRYPGARYMHARMLMRLGDLDAAANAVDAALADEPDDPWALIQRSTILAATHGHDAAIEWLAAAAARFPASAMLRTAYAEALLGVGRFREGWREYLARRLSEAPPTALPTLLPRDLHAATVVLRSEQGLGDVIFFLRFAPRLCEYGASVSLQAPHKLAPLLARCPTFREVKQEDSASAETAVYVGDLPYLLDTECEPRSIQLAPLAPRVTAWRARLAAFGPPPYIGVTWRGGTDFRQEREFGRRDLRLLFKEVDLRVLGRGLREVAGTFVSIQRRPFVGETDMLVQVFGRPVLDASGTNDDLEDALALLDVLDSYVGVSNTNMHLRAALGKTARVLVPFPPEWRWMAGGEESPWFPGFRVYRQSPQRSWDAALALLATDLRNESTERARHLVVQPSSASHS